ncbi:putative Inosine triphosphate pyrophosphatase [Seiridium cardinale]|uniref:Inosine triphosphate pyrophosphatase n=1 Tax=Seiridium cardinale TaxID=138064 RepID=A0ABR2XCP7_9PEZI
MRQIPSPPSGIILPAVSCETDNTTSMAPKEVNLMTGNANKLADIRAILGPQGILVKSQALDLPEIQGTIEEITIAKCRRAAELVRGPVLVDDTALCFEAMNGMPGPYIKFFLEAVGPEKLHLMLAGFSDKRAQAVATLGYSEGPGHEPVLFQGRVDGTIVPARGTLRYGWHACFEYPGTGQTFAEMDDEEKHRISHLGEAMRKLIE